MKHKFLTFGIVDHFFEFDCSLKWPFQRKIIHRLQLNPHTSFQIDEFDFPYKVDPDPRCRLYLHLKKKEEKIGVMNSSGSDFWHSQAASLVLVIDKNAFFQTASQGALRVIR